MESGVGKELGGKYVGINGDTEQTSKIRGLQDSRRNFGSMFSPLQIRLEEKMGLGPPNLEISWLDKVVYGKTTCASFPLQNAEEIHGELLLLLGVM